MSGHGNWSGQTPRERRESLENAPGYNGNDFPDSTGNHIYYDGGMRSGDFWVDDEDAVVADISRKFNLSSDVARSDYDGVAAFTDSYYSGIREAQKNGEASGKYADWGRQTEQFIRDGVIAGYGWKGGNTYRGIAVDDETLRGINEVPIGSEINIHNGGSASWATDVGTARSFSGNGYGNNHVIFVNLDRSQNGVSVAGISANGFDEHEVLCSKDNKYKKIGSYASGSYTYIYVRGA